MIVTRRGVLTAAVCLAGSAAVATLMRSGTGGFKSTMTTLFWVGEPSDADNYFIPNDVSYWYNQWQLSFGGVDDPEHRNGYWPAEFKPHENPFYVALPSFFLKLVTSLGRRFETFLGTVQGFHPSSKTTGSKSIAVIAPAMRNGRT